MFINKNNLLSINKLISGPIHKGPQQLHLSHQLCQPEVDVLVVQEGGTESHPLPDIVNSLVDDVDHAGDTDSAGSEPLLLELDHLVSKTQSYKVLTWQG